MARERLECLLVRRLRSEAALVAQLHERLARAYGPAGVDREARLYHSGRRVDLVVRPRHGRTLAIEVKDDGDSLRTGVGQAVEYAAALDADPVVIAPARAVEVPDVLDLARGTVSVVTPRIDKPPTR